MATFWRQRDRVYQLQVWLHAVKTCPECRLQQPIELFDAFTSDGACRVCDDVFKLEQQRVRRIHERERYAFGTSRYGEGLRGLVFVRSA